MADFNVQLAEPQGRGTDPVAPVQQQAVNTAPMGVLNELGSIFAKGLQQNNKEQILARKNAVVGEYINSQKVYDDALTSGQWNASQASTASRANYTKFIAAYPEYAEDFQKAREAFYGGSETGEAQKKVDAEKKQREADIGAASAMGYTFYPGMSEEAQNKTLDAYKYARRLEVETDKNMKAAAEQRAVNSEARANTQFGMTVDDYVAKEKAFQGAREVAAANFDSVSATFQDLTKQIQSGSMGYENALAIHTGNINRIKAGLNSIAQKNPEAAAPWIKLFDDMDVTARQLMDPTKKSADELKLLQDRFNTLITKSKLAAVESSPQLANAVVATQLFPGESMVTLAATPAVKSWILKAVRLDGSTTKPEQMVGTPGDGTVFKAAKDAINRLQTANYSPEDKDKATQEATHLVNTLLEQTTTANGEMNPAALKQASTFFASPEFGRMALAGKVDKQTAANAQHVFQTQYEPAVQNAIMRKLADNDVKNSVDFQVVGNQIKIVNKKSAGVLEAVSSAMGALNPAAAGDNAASGERGRTVQSLQEAEAGLNQLIRLHAHLEGTTDYRKYWDQNKWKLLPGVFPDPEKLKQGESLEYNGKKYTFKGGNYNDRRNWIEEPIKSSK